MALACLACPTLGASLGASVMARRPYDPPAEAKAMLATSREPGAVDEEHAPKTGVASRHRGSAAVLFVKPQKEGRAAERVAKET